ncbi:hypothetical protein CC1G_06356 [Coprinopsis cinerea okayama7|uniref:Uncharacterized protein n=1 Tax=Coprinopsis cinerea (strain Okayama-7 / 130 / ATCC MYA-4618 / FGSC 9003) TaxID=240176 RepID=A8NTM9_COPC7|nr:hypothetical protein CC1G_06356 [Coprinopsis cinerea okayama7\|eukprot:XP_001836271.2 hypothetical protein CC1G_06356 [Coprinopsis cinerea okayama7\
MDKSLRVNVIDERVNVHGFQTVPFALAIQNADSIPQFLDRTAHFYRHLNALHPRCSAESIDLKLFKLEESTTQFGDAGYPVLYPTSDNLFEDGVAYLRVHSNALDSPTMYGFEITNQSPFDLHATILYFDNSDFSITRYYPDSGSGEVIPKHGGVAHIGYNHDAATPFTYFLRENQDVDVGFLQVLLTEAPMEVDHILQFSAFTQDTGPGFLSRSPPSGGQASDIWGSMVFSIIQKRSM